MKKCDKCGKETEETTSVVICNSLPYPKGAQGEMEVQSEEEWCMDCVRANEVFRPYH